MRRKIKKIRRCEDCKELLDPDEDETYCNECYLRHIEDEVNQEEGEI